MILGTRGYMQFIAMILPVFSGRSVKFLGGCLRVEYS